jgi:tetratricopeptide (TPR) repeat protein
MTTERNDGSDYREFAALMKRRAFTGAVSFAERLVVSSSGRNGFWLTQLSIALRESGRFKESFAAADKACAIEPGNPWPVLARAEASLKQGDCAGALSDFEAVRDDGRTGARARRGMLQCLAHEKAWDRVLDCLAQWELPARERHSWRVKALMGLGRMDEAAVECDRWLAQCPDDPQALWKSVDLQVGRDGLEAVRERMARLAKIPGESPVYGEIYASLCKRSGSMQGAAAQYEKLVQRASSPAILRKQAFALAKTGEEARAAPLMEELLRLSPDDLYLHSAYVPACRRLGDIGRAWKFYHELIALHPDRKPLLGRLKRLQKMMEQDESVSRPEAGGPETAASETKGNG